jgi:hypothetical protein
MAIGTGSPDDAFGALDRRLLQVIRTQDQALRALLCTLARHGVAFRRSQEPRAARWLDELSVHPIYKGGQFLFDLLEWEDFMLEGPPPPPLDPALAAAALQSLASSLRALGARLEQREPSVEGVDVFASDVLSTAGSLPLLEPGYYLYQDVVLGALALTLARLPPGGV